MPITATDSAGRIMPCKFFAHSGGCIKGSDCRIPIFDEEFRPQFEAYKSRYKFFVIDGASRTGKSSWAYWLKNESSEDFYVNCANCMEPDLRKFKQMKHKIIILDEASQNQSITTSSSTAQVVRPWKEDDKASASRNARGRSSERTSRHSKQ